MEQKQRTKRIISHIIASTAIVTTILAISVPAKADVDPSACAALAAERADQLHGYPLGNDLSLFMAGNQFVVFENVMKSFNASIGKDPSDISRDPRYYIELIPPGLEVSQILSGCLTVGAENPENFLPFINTALADVYASTVVEHMDTLAAHGFIYKTRKYIKNKLDLMVPAGNPGGIGSGGLIDATLDLLDPAIAVSEVDHINEGIHRGINKMYRLMDSYVRSYGTPTEVAQLDARLAAVKVPQPGSPAEVRTIEEGITTNFNLETNPACNYGDGIDANDDGDFDDSGDTPPTLRFCEFAILNKANTFETRVHHIETAARIREGSSDTGPLWVSEVIYARKQAEDVEGVDIAAMDPNEEVNQPVTYYVTIVEKTLNANHKKLAAEFVNFLRSPAGQQIYEDGGFIALDDEELAFEKVFSGNTNVIRSNPRAW